MFTRILVPVDRSLLAEHILPHVMAIAKAPGTEVTLISVLDPSTENTPNGLTDPFSWQMQRAEADAYLKNLSSDLKANGLTVQTILLNGKAPDQVIQYADRLQADLIMLSSHGHGGMSNWNSSSVVMKIIQQAGTSVMLIPSSLSTEPDLTGQQYRRILAPVDGSQRAENALSVAADLAHTPGAELIIAHVIKPPELPRRMPLSAQDQDLVQSVVESNRAEGTLYLENLKKSLRCSVETRLIIADSVTEALHTLVAQDGIDLVILNAHGLGGNPHWPYGNVAANFLSYSPIPLLIVQDFNREQLGRSNLRMNGTKHVSSQRQLADMSKPKFDEMIYQSLHVEDRPG